MNSFIGFWNNWGIRMNTEIADLETLVSLSDEDNVMADLGVVSSTMVTRLDLSLACFSEKVSNL